LCLATPDQAGPLADQLSADVRLVALGDRDWRGLVSAEPGPVAQVSSDDLAWIFYTSGTTGRPKGAMLSHRNLYSMMIGYLADVDRLTPDDCFLHLAAQSHAVGLFGLSHIAKATHQIMPPSGGFDVAELAMLLRLHDSATFFLPPTGLRRLLKAGLEFFGPRLWNGYGQGESPCTITAMSKEILADAVRSGDEARVSSVGIARTGVEVAVFDADDRPLPPGEIGEVVVRGDTVMTGYWNLPAESTATLRGGWLHTGDLGAMDQRGFLTLLDRAKDLIISGGSNIYPREVEEVLLEDPDVAEVAVIGTSDPEWGESVMAVLVAAPDATLDLARLENLCLERIARFKRPKYWRVVDQLPKNSAGKVLKRELRRRFEAEGSKSD
jgi:acyl-CoA synthetase (AMP-forming)/AMP-acid ligase II